MTNPKQTDNHSHLGLDPSHIQPIGFFLMVDRQDFSVIKCSRNLADYDEAEWNETVGSLLGTEAELMLKHLNITLEEGERKNIQLPVLSYGRLESWASVVHNQLMVEVETAKPDLELASLNLNELSFLAQKLKEAHQNFDIYKRSCAMVRYLTGFERVFLIRFNSDGTSTIAGESRRKHLDTMLGLKYDRNHPINMRRNIMVENRLRAVPNLEYESVEIGPGAQDDWLFGDDYDNSVLRGLRQVHQHIMRVLGIKAFLSLPIGGNDEIDGLIFGVHQSPVLLSQEIRLLLEDFGRNISSHLRNKQREKDLSLDISLKIRIQYLIEKIRGNFPGTTLADDILPDLLDIFNNGGVAAVIDNIVYSVGECPPQDGVKLMASIARSKLQDGIFYHQCLSEIDGRMNAHVEKAAGCIAVSLDENGSDLLIFMLAGRRMVNFWISETAEPVPDQEFVEILPGYRLYLNRSNQSNCAEPISRIEVENAKLFKGCRNALVKLI